MAGLHRYVPALDGLRGVAVLLVVFRHAWADRMGGAGVVGVALFFVLSGYLITAVIVDEWHSRSAVSFRAFFARRALRLLPALFFAVTVYAVVVCVVLSGTALREALLSAFFAITYLSGYASFAGFPVVDELGPTWSLAVEEQFYLLWPVLLVVLLRRGWSFPRLAGVAFGLAVISAVIRAGTWELWASDVYKLPTTWTDGLLIGCGLAFLLRTEWAGRLRPAGAPALTVLVLASGSLLAALSVGPDLSQNPWTYRLLLLTVALAAAILIVGAVRGPVHWLLRPLEMRWLRWVGRRSYAIYLWNAILIFGVPQDWQPRRLWLVVAVAATFVAAEISWRVVEARALELKRHFEPTRVPGGRPTTEPGTATPART